MLLVWVIKWQYYLIWYIFFIQGQQMSSFYIYQKKKKKKIRICMFFKFLWYIYMNFNKIL